MHVLVYLPLVLPLLAAVAARPLADRLPPAAASWLLAASAVALAVASSAVLGLLALTALVRVPAIAAIGDLSRPVISQDDPASVPVAVVAGALLAAAVTAAARTLWRKSAAVAAAHRQARSLPGTGQVVLTDDEAADAYTLPGWPCRVVVTAGMMRALSPAEREVLLAHERAHAAGFHFLFTLAARLAAAANPLLRPVSAAVAYTVERWADEHAAAATGDRPLAARAVARAALAAHATPPAAPGPASAAERRRAAAPPSAAAQPCAAGSPQAPRAPSAAASVAVLTAVVPPATRPAERPVRGKSRHPGPVPRRVAALLSPPPRPRLLLMATAALLVLIAGVSALEAAHDLHALLEYARGTT